MSCMDGLSTEVPQEVWGWWLWSSQRGWLSWWGWDGRGACCWRCPTFEAWGQLNSLAALLCNNLWNLPSKIAFSLLPLNCMVQPSGKQWFKNQFGAIETKLVGCIDVFVAFEWLNLTKKWRHRWKRPKTSTKLTHHLSTAINIHILSIIWMAHTTSLGYH